MSLIVKKRLPVLEETTEPIECYKILVRLKNGNYRTPYTRFSVKRCTIDEQQTIYDTKFSDIAYYWPNECRIFGGFFHSFKNYTDAFTVAAGIPSTVIVKCEIPKETMYCYGREDDGSECYASKSLRFLKCL